MYKYAAICYIMSIIIAIHCTYMRIGTGYISYTLYKRIAITTH